MTQVDLPSLLETIRSRSTARRSITAVAGAPGSGKSTLAEDLVARLNAADPGCAAVFPMDGYHYDDTVLEARGWRPRKGAPHTFDVEGFGHMLARLRANDAAEIAVPVFDRSIEIARNAARIIPREVRFLIVEGNYLLLPDDPWRDLMQHFDTTVFLEVPMAELRRRLEARWQDMAPADRALKLDGNDIPNAERVLPCHARAEFVVRNG